MFVVAVEDLNGNPVTSDTDRGVRGAMVRSWGKPLAVAATVLVASVGVGAALRVRDAGETTPRSVPTVAATIIHFPQVSPPVFVQFPFRVFDCIRIPGAQVTLDSRLSGVQGQLAPGSGIQCYTTNVDSDP
jgi:hypothetical protein